ncbi:MAG TPA: dihydrolipoyl dehydrogenase [Caulobacteraceae bacterium]|nr:dihydrolipoyl dehydrogenase [Caulobacteraceae bacterium]
MPERIDAKVLVLGGGPGGYVAAIRAGQQGLPTVLVEADRLGGTCLIRGCIPSKALIHAAAEFAVMRQAAAGASKLGIALKGPPAIDLAHTVGWMDGIVDRLSGGVAALLKRAKVRVVAGWGRFSDAKTCHVGEGEAEIVIRAEQVILAAGSLPVELKDLPFGGPVISSTEALDLAEIPQRLLVVGAGYIGLELGQAFAKLGAKVTVVEALDRILPAFDRALAEPVARALAGAGIETRLETRALGSGGGALLVEDNKGKQARLDADIILVTVGRRPNTAGWGLETMGIDMAGPFIGIDDECRTSMAGVFAIGDVTGEPMLEHRAATQGEMVAEIIAGHRRRFDPAAIPAVCFTDPEIVAAGLSPEEAAAQGIEVLTGVFPLSASGRAWTMEAGAGGGFVRVTARRDDHRLIGAHAVGQGVSELSAEFSLALEMGAVLEDIAGTIHVHPTLSESFHEAALRALGHAIHV